MGVVNAEKQICYFQSMGLAQMIPDFFIVSDLTEVETSPILFLNNDGRVQSLETELWCLAVA